jgi:hypothetical protein
MENYFKGFTVEYIERNKNTEADDLAKVTAHNIPMLTNVFFQVLKDASEAQVNQYCRRTRLECSHNGIPSPLLRAR